MLITHTCLLVLSCGLTSLPEGCSCRCYDSLRLIKLTRHYPPCFGLPDLQGSPFQVNSRFNPPHCPPPPPALPFLSTLSPSLHSVSLHRFHCRSETVRHYGLSILTTKLQSDWALFSEEQKRGLLERFLKLAVSAARDNNNMLCLNFVLNQSPEPESQRARD